MSSSVVFSSVFFFFPKDLHLPCNGQEHPDGNAKSHVLMEIDCQMPWLWRGLFVAYTSSLAWFVGGV